MNIGGVNTLACISKIEDSGKATKIYPLPHMYVIKDLVPDMNNFYQQYRSIQPWLQNTQAEAKDNKGQLQNLQSVDDRSKLVSIRYGKQQFKNIGCFLICFHFSRMAFTSAFCAHAAPRLAPPTGGTVTSILDQLS